MAAGGQIGPLFLTLLVDGLAEQGQSSGGSVHYLPTANVVVVVPGVCTPMLSGLCPLPTPAPPPPPTPMCMGVGGVRPSAPIPLTPFWMHPLRCLWRAHGT